jgi:expansin (peptidoglycan-binding protein)
MQVRNSVLPVDTLEVSTNGGASWTMVTDREYYNFFTYTRYIRRPSSFPSRTG